MLFLLLLPPTPPWLWPRILVWNLRNLVENNFAKPDLGFTSKHGLGCVLWQVFSQEFPAASITIPSPLPISFALYSLARYLLHWIQRLELSKKSSPRFTFLYSTVKKGPTGITKSTNSVRVLAAARADSPSHFNYRHNFCLSILQLFLKGLKTSNENERIYFWFNTLTTDLLYLALTSYSFCSQRCYLLFLMIFP